MVRLAAWLEYCIEIGSCTIWYAEVGTPYAWLSKEYIKQSGNYLLIDLE
jgi:hypothetical protein